MAGLVPTTIVDPSGKPIYRIDKPGDATDGKLVTGYALIDPTTGAPADGGATTPAVSTPVALTVPSGTLAPGDNALAVVSACRHVWIENNSSAAINYAMDGAASAGSRLCPAAGVRILDEPCNTAVHLFVAGSTPYNGTAGSNVVVKCWA